MSKFLLINSRHRDYKSESTHDFFYTFREQVKINDGIILKGAQIGFGEYTINDYNYRFYIDSNLIELTKKNYRIDDLVIELNTKINLVLASFVVSYDENTMKFTFTNDADFNVIFIPETETNLLLGFKQIKTYASTANSLISESVINLQGSNFMHIYIDQMMATNYQYQKDTPLLTSFVVPISCNRGGIIAYYNETNENYVKLTNQFTSCRVRLLRDDNKLVNINGADVNLLFMYI
jgi:hypothetical protein